MDGASAIITPPTNQREKSRSVLAAEAGERFAPTLTTRRPAIGVLKTHNAAPAEYLGGAVTHKHNGHRIPGAFVHDRPEAILLRRARLLFIADILGGVSAGRDRVIAPGTGPRCCHA